MKALNTMGDSLYDRDYFWACMYGIRNIWQKIIGKLETLEIIQTQNKKLSKSTESIALRFNQITGPGVANTSTCKN